MVGVDASRVLASVMNVMAWRPLDAEDGEGENVGANRPVVGAAVVADVEASIAGPGDAAEPRQASAARGLADVGPKTGPLSRRRQAP